MTEEIHPHSKELDAPYIKRTEDDLFCDVKPDVVAPRLKLFGRILGLVLAIVFNIGFFIVINYFNEHIPFLTDDFVKWIPYANVSIVANIFLQFPLFFLGDTIWNPLLEACTNVFSVISMTALLVIFPISFDTITWFGPLEELMRVGLIILIGILVIAIFANIAAFLSKLVKRK